MSSLISHNTHLQSYKMTFTRGFRALPLTYCGNELQGDPYGRGVVYVDSKFEVAFNCKVGLPSRPVMEF